MTFRVVFKFFIFLFVSSALWANGSLIYGAESKILFTSDADGDFELYTMASDGSDVTQLTVNNDKDSLGRFSPDGSTIAFVRNSSEIWLMDASGEGYWFKAEDSANLLFC